MAILNGIKKYIHLPYILSVTSVMIAVAYCWMLPSSLVILVGLNLDYKDDFLCRVMAFSEILDVFMFVMGKLECK